MPNPDHLAILKQGVPAWNQWRHKNKELVDLRGANLHSASLAGVKLSGANLRGANLKDADLQQANLSGAKLHGADLTGANLNSADLTGANFTVANLNQADFTDTAMHHTVLAGVDLTQVKGLETVKHFGPSTLGIDTIYRSHGQVPITFLRGAGVPENFLEYMGSLVGTAFEFYSCFISYSTSDQDFAERLYTDLQSRGIRCWFAPHNVQGGQKLHEQIDSAIRMHERLLLVLSPHSIHSEWVKTEIATARKRESREAARVLFPIRLGISFNELQEWEYFDADRGKDSAREIREYYIPDFTGWKNHDQYRKEFEKLVRDLKKPQDLSAAHATGGAGTA